MPGENVTRPLQPRLLILTSLRPQISGNLLSAPSTQIKFCENFIKKLVTAPPTFSLPARPSPPGRERGEKKAIFEQFSIAGT